MLYRECFNAGTGEIKKFRVGTKIPKGWEVVPKPIMVKEKDGRFHAKIVMRDYVIDVIENVEGDEKEAKDVNKIAS